MSNKDQTTHPASPSTVVPGSAAPAGKPSATPDKAGERPLTGEEATERAADQGILPDGKGRSR